MTTAGVLTPFLQSTDAEFRAWVTQIIADLTAVGWVPYTVPSGQIDPLTVTKPTGGTQAMGYKYFTPDDGLADFYLRVGFGAAAHGALEPGLWVAVGWNPSPVGIGWDDARSSVHFLLYGQNGNQGMTTIPRMCKSGSAFWFQWHEANGGGSSTNHAFGVDRWRDPDGTPNEDGIVIIAAGCGDTRNVDNYTQSLGTPNTFIEAVPAASGRMYPIAVNRAPYAAPNTSGTWSIGDHLGVSMVQGWHGGPTGPFLGAIVGSLTDFPATGDLATVRIAGADHTFRRTDARPDNGGIGRYLMIWE